MASDAEIRAWCAAGARERVARVVREDALNALARGEFDDLDEAESSFEEMPAPAALAYNGDSVREYVRKHGANWKPHVRERWLLEAERLDAGELSDQTRSLYAKPDARARWLLDGVVSWKDADGEECGEWVGFTW